jgi:peptidoglycan/xylan/chitin deacetylase (PgdA/CDA1 family)
MAHHCKNHPDAVTRKRCYTCREYVCPDCIRTFMGQSFCSLNCWRKSLLSQIGHFFTAGKKTNLPWSVLYRALPHLFYLCLFVILWVAIRNLSHEMSALRQPVAAPPSLAPAVADTVRDRSHVSLSEPQQAQVTETTIEIVGEADNNIAVSLLVNGELKAVTISADRRFAFEKITLKAGDNELLVRGLDEHGHVSVLEKIITVSGQPVISISAADFSRGPGQRRQMALTFDGGSGDGNAKAILDYLEQKGVTCTFFLTGEFMKKYPEMVRRIVQQGHEVGNHTWSHPRLTTVAQNNRQETRAGMTREKLRSELTRTADYFFQLTGRPMAKYWRAPFGEHNAEIRAWAAELGYRHIGWTVANGQSLDALDWVADKKEKIYQSSQKILSRLLSFGRDTQQFSRGGIILMHLDSQRSDDPVHPIIPTLIDSITHRGYQLATISQMMTVE